MPKTEIVLAIVEAKTVSFFTLSLALVSIVYLRRS